MDDFVKRPEYNDSIGRIHDKVNAIDKAVGQIEIYTKIIKETTDKIGEAVYGNGGKGLISKLSSVVTKVNVQWWMFSLVIAAIAYIVKELYK